MEKEKTFKIELHLRKTNKSDSYSTQIKANDIFSAFEKARAKARNENKDILIFTGGSIELID